MYFMYSSFIGIKHINVRRLSELEAFGMNIQGIEILNVPRARDMFGPQTLNVILPLTEA